MPTPAFIDHLVFRVSDLVQTERFYTALFGQQPEQTDNSLMYLMGETRLFFTTATTPETHDKEQIGLNHIAFGVGSVADLRILPQQLDAAGITHSGVKLDPYGLKEFIWLDDPDGIRIEFYLRPRS